MNVITIIILCMMGVIGSFIVGFEFGCYVRGKNEMKLIINIPEKAYKERLNNSVWFDSNMDNAIRNGTPLEEELEKIKAEMQEEHTKHTCFYVNGNHYCDHWGDLQIINNHIAELKGENE